MDLTDSHFSRNWMVDGRGVLQEVLTLRLRFFEVLRRLYIRDLGIVDDSVKNL